MLISVVIPAHNEEHFLPQCLDSVQAAARHAAAEIELIVVLNRCTDRTEDIALARGCRLVSEDARNLSVIRNAGAASATGDVIVTVDADSRLHRGTFRKILHRLESNRYIGGATPVLPDRLSLGIVFSLAAVVPYLIRHGLSFGLFWCYRRDFEAIGGFDESFLSVEDVDFRRRLKQHGRRQGRRFGTLWFSPLLTSTRKFDLFGDWYLFRNPAFLRRVFGGKDREAADSFWYDARK